jgi:hypothetical protein
MGGSPITPTGSRSGLFLFTLAKLFSRLSGRMEFALPDRSCSQRNLVPENGVEPSRPFGPHDFESGAFRHSGEQKFRCDLGAARYPPAEFFLLDRRRAHPADRSPQLLVDYQPLT